MLGLVDQMQNNLKQAPLNRIDYLLECRLSVYQIYYYAQTTTIVICYYKQAGANALHIDNKN